MFQNTLSNAIYSFACLKMKGFQMEYKEIFSIINEIDQSLDKQINIISFQLSELKKQISKTEKYLKKINRRP